METVRIAGEASYRVETERVTFAVTRSGGMLGPALFDLGGRLIQPLAIAPWGGTTDAKGLPPILRALRGDFFCMPFGGNGTPFQGEVHPLHGETANADWQFLGLDRDTDSTTLRLLLEPQIRPCRIEKRVTVRTGHLALYCDHRIEGLSGPMSYGHHAMLEFPDEEGAGLVSVSPFRYGQVFPGDFEEPAKGGYTSLRPAAVFEDLSKVPRADGETADLSRYPAREGFEDLAMVSAEAGSGFAWSAVVVPKEGYLWLALKNPATLPSTVLWHSNGGRHYPPWNGRHRRVLGIEEVCANFHFGLAESAEPNPISDEGIPTCRPFTPDPAFSVRYVMAVHPIEPGTGHVREVRSIPSGAKVLFEGGEPVSVPVDPDFVLS